jgi:hypothetical protein
MAGDLDIERAPAVLRKLAKNLQKQYESMP